MSLTSAIRTATGSLAGTSQQVSLLSRNIAGVGNPDYVRREAVVSTDRFGQMRVETQRQVNLSLFSSSITARSKAEASAVLSSGFDALARIQDLDNYSLSAFSQLQGLRDAVDLAATMPGDNATMNALLEQARTAASTISGSYQHILRLRAEADAQIVGGVERLNSLLSELKGINDQIVNGTRVGEDMSDAMDSRDTLINRISEEIGVDVLHRANNDVVLVASNGVILFEKQPRTVSFSPTASYGPSTTGNALYVDGIPVSGANASLPLTSGAIAGQLSLRDGALQDQLNQLDEIARGMVELFAETDQTGGGKPPLAGLFTWSGGPTVPASGALTSGIALTLSVNPLVDPAQGGDMSLVRDGAINGDADYLYNTDGSAGFSDRLYAIAEGFSADMSFDMAAGLGASRSLLDYSAASLDWLSEARRSANDTATYQSGLASHFKETLQSATGPNLDQEMSRLLEVERAYQASAKMLATIDELFNVLMQAA